MKNKLFFSFFYLFFVSTLYSATYVVDNAGDVDDGLAYTVSDGTNTLRKCIRLANANAGADIITFNLGTSGGPFAINLTSNLPAISDATGGLTIDGWTNTSNNGTPNSILVKSTSSASPMNPVYKVIINNSSGTVTNGLTLQSNSNVVQGLAFYNIGVTTLAARDTCVSIRGNSNQVLGCFIGISTDGTTGLRRTEYGVCIRGANNSVGDGTAAGANLISGTNDSLTSYCGILIVGAGASGNNIKGNMIGLQKDGETATTSEQQQYGIYMSGCGTGNVIGGTNANDGNVISGNKQAGVYLTLSANGTIFKGNFIGPKASGNGLVTGGTQQTNGLLINSSANCIVGGSNSNERNVCSGNNTTGVQIANSTSTGNVVKGNYIGIGADGTTDITGQDYGVFLQSQANANTIGGTATGEGNVISGNGNGAGTGYGIHFFNSGPPPCYSNTVVGNIIGLKADGINFHTADQSYGIWLQGYSNTIGGSSSTQKNIISGNGTYGIYITSSNGYNNVIQGNYIGLQSNGTTIVTGSPQNYGVYITSSAYNNTIGGTVTGEGNVLSGNDDAGVYCNSTHASGNKFYGNIVGLRADASTYVTSNSQTYGIQLFTSHNNVIGGSTSGHRNIITGNTSRQIQIDLTTTGASTGNIIKGNYIGLGSNGTSYITNSQQFAGIELGGTANNNIIGGTANGEANIVSGMGYSGGASCVGIWVYSSSTLGNSIIGNIIGPAADGVTEITGKPGGAVRYLEVGIGLYGAVNTTVQRNVVLGCGALGFHFYRNIYNPFQNTNGCTIKGNYIGVASDGVSFHSSNTQFAGIYIDAAPSGGAYNNTIGGTTAADANIISGNDDGSGGGVGIYLASSNTTGNTIIGNIIGPRGDGSTFLTNIQDTGIVILSSPNNTIGGTTSAYKNIISANGTIGIHIRNSGSTGNLIKGNYIGIASNGTSGIASSSQDYGIYLTNASNSNLIGGTTADEKNVISGNTTTGVFTNSSGGNSVYGNIIGLQVNGTAGITTPAQTRGVHISSSPGNTIGGTSSSYRNIITGNSTGGIYVEGSSSTSNIIKANYIGVDINGVNDITSPNQLDGIVIGDAVTSISPSSIVIGGSGTGEGNVVSGNTQYGIRLSRYTSGTTIKGNILGVQGDGNTLVAGASQDYGVFLSFSGNNTIGGTNTGEGNVISGNVDVGILFTTADASGNNVLGNYIGPRSTGTAVVTGSSQDYGIWLFNSSHSNFIHNNLISGNTVQGIRMFASSIGSNTVTGNIIGPQKDGTTNLGTQVTGIYIENTPDNIIGGTTASERNIISANTTNGIYIINTNSTGNQIKGNYIGVASNGTSYITGNSQDYGINIASTAPSCVIGGTNSGDGNVISGNTLAGVYLNNSVGTNTVVGNIIGAAASGTTSLGASNQTNGVLINTSHNNIIGGSTAAARNVISDNLTYGVDLTGTATGNIIQGNYIGIATDGQTFITSSGQDYGVFLTSATVYENTVGGTSAGQGNVISGNYRSASAVGAGIADFSTSTSSNYIYGNTIGLQHDGLSYVSAGASVQHYGIYISNASNTIIGGSTSSHRNIISGNSLSGVYLTGASATGTQIKGNYIGIGNDGASFVTGSSQGTGIYLTGTAPTTTLGGTNTGEGNVISGNSSAGIVSDYSTNHNIVNNIIGLRANGTHIVTGANQQRGIVIQGSDNTIIGGTTANTKNTISGNTIAGIEFGGAVPSNNTLIAGNIIGLASDGSTIVASASQDYGITFCESCEGIIIGGTTVSHRNIISGNTVAGIFAGGQAGPGNITVKGNYIGTQSNGTSNVTSNTQETGVDLSGALSGWIIGGSAAAEANTISGNLTYGIKDGVNGMMSQGNYIQGNYIGGQAGTGNTIAGAAQDYGIYFSSSSTDNIIGGSVGTQRNVISYNTADGVYIGDAGSSNNLISQNLIYSNTNKAINLNGLGNANFASPVVNTNYTSTTINGTATANAIIEVFKKVAGGTNHCQQAQQYLGTTTANGSGVWSFAPGGTILNVGETPLATARSNVNNNTSEFNCPSTAIGLPIELLYFNAEKTDEKTVKTYWQTATEINNDYFTVQRSTDALEFEDIGIIDGAGNSSSVISYQLLDNSFPTLNFSTLYYRLKQTDFDGTYSYSNIVAVDLSKNNSSLSNFNIYPNPTTSENINIEIFGELNNEVLIIVRDVLGKELYAKVFITESENTTINLSDGFILPAGVYTITASSKNDLVSKKIIIQ